MNFLGKSSQKAGMKWSRTFEALKQVADVGGVMNKSVILQVPFHALNPNDYKLVSFYTRNDYYMYFELEKNVANPVLGAFDKSPKKPELPQKKLPDLEKPTQHSHYLA